MNEPQPGEAWVITQPQYGSEDRQVIYDCGPFIVTHITKTWIAVVAAANGTEPLKHNYKRGDWDWDEHATRIWPPVPTWEELAQTPALASDDLRAQVME